MKRTFGARVYDFYSRLESPRVPRGVAVMNPYASPRTRKYARAFLSKYFDDDRARTLILGINPGRFGAGITGVTFVDPIGLARDHGIRHDLAEHPELSATFIALVVERLGGPKEFYRRFFLSAVSPLGFTRGGLNLNYYDDRRLQRAVTPFIVETIERQLELGGRRDRAIVLGRGKNAAFFKALNETHRWFESIDVLDHPRFIMQYRRKKLAQFLGEYERTLGADPRLVARRLND
jgi:hypothetical protein